MKKRYRFRKVYFICQDKRILPADVIMYMSTAYRTREAAEANFRPRDPNQRMAWEKNVHIPVESIEAFYMVPAALYGEVLSPHKFRLMYFVCINRQSFETAQSLSTTAFQNLQWALSNQKYRLERMLESDIHPLPFITVEPFYLVAEQRYDELLKPHVED